jgi:hypothetical protein
MSVEQRAFDRIEPRLAEYYSAYERVVWWSSEHPLLNDRRPIECLTLDAADVERVLDQLDARRLSLTPICHETTGERQ